ncbi:hypothetical protein RHCRD62_50178 [Rhodococcus sp. RD6.2]|nr:hypothetical protein RHCRD62_50178 [Rhodococcus sp. RD6.2]
MAVHSSSDARSPEQRAADASPEELAFVLPVGTPPPPGAERRGDRDTPEVPFLVDAHTEGVQAEIPTRRRAPPLQLGAAKSSVLTDRDVDRVLVAVDRRMQVQALLVLGPAHADTGSREEYRFDREPSCGAARDVVIGRRHHRHESTEAPAHLTRTSGVAVETEHRDTRDPRGRGPHEPDAGSENLGGGEPTPRPELDLAAHGQAHRGGQWCARRDRPAQPPPRPVRQRFRHCGVEGAIGARRRERAPLLGGHSGRPRWGRELGHRSSSGSR